MSLAELWSSSRVQLETKLVHQIIAFAGTGQFTDGSPAAAEFREFLGIVPSGHLSRYSDECLRESFTGSGFALQDVVNQIGRRLGYSVVDGRYRGTVNEWDLTACEGSLTGTRLLSRSRQLTRTASTFRGLRITGVR